MRVGRRWVRHRHRWEEWLSVDSDRSHPSEHGVGFAGRALEEGGGSYGPVDEAVVSVTWSTIEREVNVGGGDGWVKIGEQPR